MQTSYCISRLACRSGHLLLDFRGAAAIGQSCLLPYARLYLTQALDLPTRLPLPTLCLLRNTREKIRHGAIRSWLMKAAYGSPSVWDVISHKATAPGRLRFWPFLSGSCSCLRARTNTLWMPYPELAFYCLGICIDPCSVESIIAGESSRRDLASWPSSSNLDRLHDLAYGQEMQFAVTGLS